MEWMLGFSCFLDQEGKLNNMTKNGMITKVSAFDFDTTYDKLKTVIDNNPNLKIIVELDHSKNAANNGLTLQPTKIIMFGNPMLGTPLMRATPTTGLDLPQKVLVYQEVNGSVKVVYNNPSYLAERHGIEDKNEVLEKITGALDKITEVATK